MVRLRNLLFTVIVAGSPFFFATVRGETDSDIAFLCSLSHNSHDHERKSRRYAFFFPPYEVSEIRMFAYLFIEFYQNFFSSQNYNICAFEPSCSHYGQEAVATFGFLRGIVLTSDRLERCNPFAIKYHYPISPITNKLVDPVDDPSFVKRIIP
jgi:uncharacterized protein